MSESRRLRVNAGFCSRKGRRPGNQDFVGLSCDGEDAALGHVVAVADGVSSGNGGRCAAELAVRSFIEAHYQGQATQGVARNAARAMEAFNGWLYATAAVDERLSRAATTFTAAVLAGREAHVIHVGDTRAYLLRDGELQRLTEDHTLRQPERDHVLLRAVGMEATLRLDHGRLPLRLHDRLLLCSDGVHGVLGDERISALVQRRRSPAEDAAALVEAALDQGSQDNASCAIVDVLELPDPGAAELFAEVRALPLADAPKPGTVLDGFRIHDVVSTGRYSRLLRATDETLGTEVVLKFPHGDATATSPWLHAFMREAWVAARLQSPFLGEILTLTPGRQSCLYAVMPFYDGETLEARLNRRPAVTLTEGIETAQKLSRAITALHRAGVIHRDIKPENVLLERNGGLKLLDLGVVRLPRLDDPGGPIPGTPSYMAPELFDGEPGDERSDQFALGVTLYRMFSGRYPFGEIEAFSRPRFGQPAPLSRYRADLPAWLGHLLSRAFAVDRNGRFGDVLEFSMELEGAMHRGVPVVPRQLSLYERNPLRFWQAIAAMLAVLLVISLGLQAHR
jgi:serine/threonine protein phosphatase PrpC